MNYSPFKDLNFSRHIRFILFLVIAYSNLTFADLEPTPDIHFTEWKPDLAFGAAARSMPFGASIGGELGLNRLVWGDPKSTDKLYGFVRPYVKGSTSAVVNRATIGFDLFPVSFVGLSWGGSASARFTTNYATLNCLGLQCDGSLKSIFVSPKIIVGYHGFFAGSIVRFDWISASQTILPFAEETQTLVGSSGSDILKDILFLAGYETGNATYGVLIENASMLQSGNNNLLLSTFTKFRLNTNWALSGGAGQYQSSTQGPSFTGFLKLEWSNLNTLSLF